MKSACLTIISKLILLQAVCLTYVCCIVSFHYTQNINPTNIENDQVSTWSFIGSVSGATGEIGNVYATSVLVQATSITLCTVDLNQCTNQAPAAGDEGCVCTGETTSGGNTVYTFTVQKRANSQGSGQTVSLTLGVIDILSGVVPVTDTSQTYPTVFEPIVVTFNVSGNRVTLSPRVSNNVTYNGTTTNPEVQFCASNVVSGTFHLNGAGVTLTNDCIVQDVNALSSVVFTYSESGGLGRNSSYTVYLVAAPEDESSGFNVGVLVGILVAAFISIGVVMVVVYKNKYG